jgi:NAD-dependent oxidoreductase involved in siderophore biosynthesis
LRFSFLMLCLACLAPTSAYAQLDIGTRNSFPGRRIGGGTRGECWSRLFSHLVPANSVHTLGSLPLIAVLEGPAKTPRPLVIELRTVLSSGLPDPYGKVVFKRILLPAPAGITLVSLDKLKQPVAWTSAYFCPDSPAPTDEPLFFVTNGEPPPLSLLLPSDPSPEDRKLWESLTLIYKACGQTFPRQMVKQLFGFGDLVGDDWPDNLPVRCL